MTARTKEKGGSFRELRDRHLPMFDQKLQRHDRGWPHPPPEAPKVKPSKPSWQTIGILHFRNDEDSDS